MKRDNGLQLSFCSLFFFSMTFDSYLFGKKKKSHTKALLDTCLSGGSGVSIFGDLSVIPFSMGH